MMRSGKRFSRADRDAIARRPSRKTLRGGQATGPRRTLKRISERQKDVLDTI